MNITEELANFVAAVDFSDLPAEAITRAKPLILDSIGVSIAGADSPVGRIVARLGRHGAVGQDATVMGANYSTSAASAAFINGTFAHALDMDDTAANTIAHPSSSIVPALFALAEKHSISGKVVLTAYVLGLEVFYRISLASNGQMRGWHRTSLFGAPATAAACARLLGLTPERIAAAIGISTSLAGGLQINFGTMSKSVQVGNASRSGLVAALLASDGCTAHDDSLGDPNGFGMAFYAGHFDANKIAAELGSPYSIIHPGIAVKIHPCCGLTHAPADIALELASSHDVTAGQIEEIVIFGEPLLPEVLTYHQPRTGYQGKYSMEYVVSAAIIDRQISPESFTDFQVNRPEITALVRRVKCITRADSDWGTLRTHAWGHPAEVVIRLKDGRMVSGKAPCARGYPELPLSDEDILEKFRACTRSVLTPQATATLAERLLSLETENSIADLIGLSSARLQ